MSIYHQILGISESASVPEIKETYRQLCKKYHPDISNDESIDKTAILNEAYDYLIKEEKASSINDGNKKSRSVHDVVVYKDQAYAFYKQGSKIYKETRYYSDRFELYYDKDEVSKFQKSILKSLYYFNIVCMQYSESEWYEDSIEKIKLLNRDRDFIKNVSSRILKK
jgi:DnaJ-class molecular chaperone with C-terminal Zn finger domain